MVENSTKTKKSEKKIETATTDKYESFFRQYLQQVSSCLSSWVKEVSSSVSSIQIPFSWSSGLQKETKAQVLQYKQVICIHLQHRYLVIPKKDYQPTAVLLGLPPFFLTIRTKACPNASSEVSQWWVNLVVIQVLSTQRRNILSFNWVGERLGNGHEHPTHGNIP